MEKDQKPQDSSPAGRRTPAIALADLGLAFRARVLWPLGDGCRALAKRAGHSFEWAGWAARRAVIWPLQDEFDLLSGPGRVIAAAGSAVALVAVGAGIYLSQSSGGSSAAPATVAVAAADPSPAPAPAPKPKPAEPTLHGATPVFAPTKGRAADATPPKTSAKPAAPATSGAPSSSSSPTSTSSSSSAATGKISSRPSAPGSVGAEISAIPGKPAGAKALSVARKFSGAFVVYETRGKGANVSSTFGDTATPELAKALLKRPPRQPAAVNVPKAKVLNIVPGPSRGSVYTVSVSLLRVGVTSELRLEMEKLKGEGWRVTNVLG